MTIGIIIMAAGKSHRFKAESNGVHKLISKVPGSELTVLEMTYQKVCKSYKPSEIVIVTNQDEPMVTLLAKTLGCRTLEIKTDGLGTSIANAMSILMTDPINNTDSHDQIEDEKLFKLENFKGIYLLPADLPFILSETLMLLKGILEKTTATTVRPVFNGIPGHPVGFKQAAFSALCQLTGDEGARSVLTSYRPETISVFDTGILWDVDTPKDLMVKPHDPAWFSLDAKDLSLKYSL